MTDIAMEQRARARATWGAGNWDEVSRFLPPVGQVVLDVAGVGLGMEVVDVGTGSGGTVAIPAALRGARVVGVDVTPENFPPALRRGGAGRGGVAPVAGGAADKPLGAGNLDIALSGLSHALAPPPQG